MAGDIKVAMRRESPPLLNTCYTFQVPAHKLYLLLRSSRGKPSHTRPVPLHILHQPVPPQPRGGSGHGLDLGTPSAPTLISYIPLAPLISPVPLQTLHTRLPLHFGHIILFASYRLPLLVSAELTSLAIYVQLF